MVYPAVAWESVFQARGMKEFEPLLSRFDSSMYLELLSDAMEQLNTDVLYHSKLHGEGHIRRTMLFGALLSMELGLSREDAILLQLGCSYHDVGRVSDRIDDAHGKRSAAQIEAITKTPDGSDLDLLRAMVEAHSLDDSDLDGVLYRHGVARTHRARTLALLLKDADALDRVRIPHLLDTRYFRFPVSHTLLPFAFRFYDIEQVLLHQMVHTKTEADEN